MRISDWRSDVCTSDLGVVVEEVVQLLARLQAVDDVLLRSIAAHGFVEAARGLVHRPVRAAAVERDVDARFAQLVRADKLRRTEPADDWNRVGEGKGGSSPASLCSARNMNKKKK